MIEGSAVLAVAAPAAPRTRDEATPPPVPTVIVLCPAGQDLSEMTALLRRECGTDIVVVPSVDEAIRAARTRAGQPGDPAAAVAASPIEVLDDRNAMRIGATDVSLTPLEHEVLRRLVARADQVLTFQQLSLQVWGTLHVGDASQIKSVIKRLRRKLHDCSAPVSIVAERGVGYRLQPCCEEAQA